MDNNDFFHFQAFASERVFGILSETLYNLLQLVSVPVVKKSKYFTSFVALLYQLIIFICFIPFGFPHRLVFQDWEQRQEEDNLLIERILLLVRNVLHVPADPCEEKV